MDTELDHIIYMKYGVHAGHTVEEIIARKSEEYHRTGKMFWGYGGTICHPTKQVQPFVRDIISRGTGSV